MKIEQATNLTKEQMRILFEWGEDVFGGRIHNLVWRKKFLHFLSYEQNRLMSNVSVLKHEIKVGEQNVLVGGIASVATVPAGQKKGYASALVKHATEFLFDEFKVDACLLFCLDRLVPFYARLGYHNLSVPILIEQPQGRVASPMNVMINPRGDFVWPAGSVDLQSQPW